MQKQNSNFQAHLRQEGEGRWRSIVCSKFFTGVLNTLNSSRCFPSSSLVSFPPLIDGVQPSSSTHITREPSPGLMRATRIDPRASGG